MGSLALAPRGCSPFVKERADERLLLVETAVLLVISIGRTLFTQGLRIWGVSQSCGQRVPHQPRALTCRPLASHLQAAPGQDGHRALHQILPAPRHGLRAGPCAHHLPHSCLTAHLPRVHPARR